MLLKEYCCCILNVLNNDICFNTNNLTFKFNKFNVLNTYE